MSRQNCERAYVLNTEEDLVSCTEVCCVVQMGYGLGKKTVLVSGFWCQVICIFNQSLPARDSNSQPFNYESDSLTIRP